MQKQEMEAEGQGTAADEEFPYSVKVVRITTTCHLSVDIDLSVLSREIKGIDYAPDILPGCAYLKKRDNPNLKGFVMIWKSGTLTSIAKNREDTEKDMNYALEKIAKAMEVEIKTE